MIGGNDIIGLFKKATEYLVAMLLLLLVGGIIGGKIGYENGKAKFGGIAADTIVVTKVDTVTLVGKRDTLISYVWKPYPVTIYDTIVKADTQFAYLPYEHRHYSRRDTLDIWYSGVDPSIDSARIYIRNTTEIISQPYEVIKMPKLTAEIGASAFYCEGKVNPFLVGEMCYYAPKTTLSAGAAVNQEGRWAVGVGVTYRINLFH